MTSGSVRVTAQQAALAHLRRRIADGSMAPESWIRQEHLAEQLGSSVVPVREALKVLEAEGLVRYAPHRGYQVALLSLEELTETYRIRQLLEDEVVRIAVPRLTAENFDRLDQAIAEMEAAAERDDTAAMIDANRELHFTVFEAAGRPRTVDFIRMLWQSTDSYRSVYYVDPEARDRVNREHRSIVEALRRGEVEQAVAELGQHRAHAVATLSERFRPSTG